MKPQPSIPRPQMIDTGPDRVGDALLLLFVGAVLSLFGFACKIAFAREPTPAGPILSNERSIVVKSERLASQASPLKPPHGISLGCQIVGVIDGDTIEVEVTRRVRVRLLDCWAPEVHTTDAAEKERGLEAKLALAAIAVGRAATLFVPTDQADRLGDVWTFDRLLGHVWLEGDDQTLSARQVQRRHAASAKGGRPGE